MSGKIQKKADRTASLKNAVKDPKNLTPISGRFADRMTRIYGATAASAGKKRVKAAG